MSAPNQPSPPPHTSGPPPYPSGPPPQYQHPHAAPPPYFHQQPAPKNGLGIAALCLGIIGLLFGLVPLTGFMAFGCGVVGVILGLAARGRLQRGRATNKGVTWAGIITGLVAVVLGIVGMVIVFTAVDKLGDDLDNIDKQSSQTFAPSKRDGADDSPSQDGPTFENGVLTTPDLKIQITRYKIVQTGQKGNEYGEKPVIAFWYKTTNLSGADVSPMDFLFNFTAYQDNNPNAENELEVGLLPDDRFLETQTEKIKKGGTVENAMAYELDDMVTPVDLVATEGLDDVIGKATYKLK